MKWLIAGILLYLTRHSEAGALKCTPNSRDLSCASEKRAISPVQSLIELEREPESADIQCLAGSEWESNCHKCRCSASGTAVCLKQENCDIKSSEEPIKCKPFTSFRRDCNTCTCLKNGHGLCTLRGCLQERRSLNIQKRETIAPNSNSTLTRQTRAAQRTSKTCQPGQEFRMDCNKCLCDDKGYDFSCTRNDCAAVNGNGGGDTFASARTKRDLSEQVETECVAGSVFDRECNVCRCTSDGKHATCTLKRCKQAQEVKESDTEATPSFRCTPGDQFQRDCNDCTCSADGKTVFCTVRLCDQDQVLPEV